MVLQEAMSAGGFTRAASMLDLTNATTSEPFAISESDFFEWCCATLCTAAGCTCDTDGTTDGTTDGAADGVDDSADGAAVC